MLLFPLTRAGLRLRGLGRSGRGGSCCGRCGGRCMSDVRRNGPQRLRASGAARERQQGDVASALDGHAQPTLVTRANTGHAARENFAAFLDKLRENVRALIVDEVHLLDTELADFFLAEILALAARPSAGTARTTAARSAFAARTTMAASGTAMAASAFAARGPTVRLCLFRFLCHTILPFSLRTEKRKSKNENQPAACCSGAGGGVEAGTDAGALRRERRAARCSRFPPSFFWRFRSSSRRTVKYLITTSWTRRRRSSSEMSSP